MLKLILQIAFKVILWNHKYGLIILIIILIIVIEEFKYQNNNRINNIYSVKFNFICSIMQKVIE